MNKRLHHGVFQTRYIESQDSSCAITCTTFPLLCPKDRPPLRVFSCNSPIICQVERIPPLRTGGLHLANVPGVEINM